MGTICAFWCLKYDVYITIAGGHCIPVYGRFSDYVQTCAYCSPSSAWELAEDPLPRLALLLVCQQALLVYRIPWDIHPHARTAQLVLARTSVTLTVDAEFWIAVVQSTLVVNATRRLTPP